VGQAEEQDDGCELLHCCQIAAMKRTILAQSAIENKGKQAQPFTCPLYLFSGDWKRSTRHLCLL
jgi:hypothetical protein